MNPRERGFLLLTSRLGNPDRQVLSTAQLRMLALRMRGRECAQPEREMTRQDFVELGYDRETAERRLSAALPEIEDAARARIAAEGETQAVTAELRPTAFPTREYEDFSLPAGDYLALRVVLGEGEGHNWWCVVFPPLCAETTSDLSQTAMAAGLTEDDIALITESDGYQLKFKAVELWGRLKAYFS